MHTLQRDKDKDMSDIRIGERQTLTVLRSADFGIYLGPEHSEESVLLPKKQVPEGTKPGDKLSVFIYRDSEDRVIATTRTPLVLVHQFAYLTVRSVARVGVDVIASAAAVISLVKGIIQTAAHVDDCCLRMLLQIVPDLP